MPLTQPMDEELRLALPDLTRAERQLASHILTHYPVAALGSITALAKAGGVCPRLRWCGWCKSWDIRGIPTFSARFGGRWRRCSSRPWSSNRGQGGPWRAIS